MNGIVAAMVQRSRGVEGTFASTGGEPTPTDPAVRQSLTQALDNLERARATGDADLIYGFELLLDKAVDNARAARNAAQEGVGTSFDGGVRGGSRTVAPPAGTYEESPADLFVRMVEASRAANADQPQVIGPGF
jgi:hypothetical protein